MKNATMKNIRAKKLEVGKTYIAMIWHTRVRREIVEVTVKDITDDGMVTDKMNFAFVTKNNVTCAKVDGKLKYTTWKVAKAPAKVEKQEVKPATKKRARKPLTAEQKARKNELARARRAAKKAAKA